MAQDNETLQDRISKAVSNAVLEAGRPHPGAKDVYLDADEVLFGLCDAIASTALAMGGMPEDRELGAKLMETMEERIVSRMKVLTAAIRSGELRRPPEDGPKLRLVDGPDAA